MGDQAGASGVMIAFGWLLLITGWIVERPYSTVLLAFAVVVFLPEAVRAYRKWKTGRETAR